MATYLLNWNPERWDWVDLAEKAAAVSRGESRDFRWSTGNRKNMSQDDRVYLLRLGIEPRGIVASGVVKGEVYQSEDWAEHQPKTQKLTNYVDFDFDVLVNPESEPKRVLSVETLKEHVPEVDWHPQASGVLISEEAANAVAQLWHDRNADILVFLRPDEVVVGESFSEGGRQTVAVNRYERDASARRSCIKHWGHNCIVCGIDFQKRYGERGAGFIEVHHLTAVADMGNDFKTDPIKDMRPVCPNCHAMIHRRKPMLSPEGLRKLIAKD